MLNRKGRRAPLLALALTLAGAAVAAAQDSDAPRPGPQSRAETNYEVHIHLLSTADGAGVGARVPQSLDGVVRHLKSALPPSDYRLAATFIYRVRDGGTVEAKTASGVAFGSAPTPGQHPPTTFQISLGNVKTIDPASAQPSISLQQFRLGMKVPVQAAAVRSDRGEGGYPVVQYEDVGLNAQFSVREGEPTLVGTLDSSSPGQLFVIVLTVRRAGR